MTEKTVRKPYSKPIVKKQCRLTQITEDDTLVVSGAIQGKGGCFSNNR